MRQLRIEMDKGEAIIIHYVPAASRRRRNDKLKELNADDVESIF